MTEELYVKLRSIVIELSEDELDKLFEMTKTLRAKQEKECIKNDRCKS